MLGVLAGVVGALLPWIFYGIRDLFRRLPGPPRWKPALGGLLVGVIGLAVPEILGPGYGWVQLAIAGNLSIGTLLLVLAVKAPAMGLTIGSGGSGGVFAPTMTMGALLGGAVGLSLASLFPNIGVVPAAFAVVGMAAVFAGAARTPISTLIMVAEMTGGYALIVPAMLSNITAFIVQRSLTQGRRYPTLYQAQVPSREDSPASRGIFVRRALDMIEGGRVDGTEVTLPRLISLLRFGRPIPVAQGAEVLVAVRVEAGSPLDGATVAQGIGSLNGAMAVAILREEKMAVPRGPTLLAAGDQVIVVANRDDFEELRRRAGEPPTAAAPPPD